MLNFRRPELRSGAVILGAPPVKRFLSLIPIVAAMPLALTLETQFVAKVFDICAGAVFTLGFLYLYHYQIAIDQDRMLIRNPVWKTIELDQLVEMKAVPATRSGPIIAVADRNGVRSALNLGLLNAHGRSLVCQALQPYATREGIRLTGPVQDMLAQLVEASHER